MKFRFARVFLVVAFALTRFTAARGGEGVLDPEITAKRITDAPVRVSCERAGATYALGEPVRFRVSLGAGVTAQTVGALRYRVGPEGFPGEEKTAEFTGNALVIEGGTLNEPGFLRCAVTVHIGGRDYRGVATAAVAPEAIRPTQVEPADFDAFWSRGKSELAKIPLEARLQLIPEASTGAVNVYHVSFRNWSRTSSENAPGRIYGILCEPKKPGRYPVMLRLPPAGTRPYAGERALAARGAITLEIGIHGIPVNQPREIYDQLRTAALDGYPSYNLDDPERYYFHRVILGCVRSLDFLTSRENWDGKQVAVFGASQGGMLAVATAALDSRVTAVAAMIPAFCDVTGYLHGRAGGWPHMFRSVEAAQRSPEKLRTTGYYDTVNFAKRLRIPVLMAVAFNDEACPPTSVFAAYNAIVAPKEMWRDLTAAHTLTPPMDAKMRLWLDQRGRTP